jgi:WD40 repeat protein
MNLRTVVVFIFVVLFLPNACHSQEHTLEFVKQIGVGWQSDKYGWMSFVAFSPDGKLVASDGASSPDDVSGNLTIWSFPDGKLINQLPGRPTIVSGNWKYYATFHGVRNFDTGNALTSLGDDVYAVHSFSPDSRYAVESVPGNRTKGSAIRVLELPSGKQVAAFGDFGAFALAISPDGKTLAAGHWNVVTLWNLMTGEKLATLHGLDRYVRGLAFNKDGGLLAASTDLGSVQIWDTHRLERIHFIQIGGGEVSEPKFSPDGRFVAVGIYGTGTAFLLDVATGKIVDKQKVSDLGCGSVAFSPDGTFLITPSTGGLIKQPHDQGGTVRVFRFSAL